MGKHLKELNILHDKMKKRISSKELRKYLKQGFNVTIFGSARIRKGDKEYEDVYKLARMIGAKGMNLVTGGGPGLMEAASAGHKSNGNKNHAKTIGLNIKLPHEQRTNPYVDIMEEFTRFSERLDHFMLFSNAVVVAHGGIGTLLELFFTWQLMQVKHTCNIPIILLGKQWDGLLKWLKNEPLKRRFFDQSDYGLLFKAKNSKEAMKIIEQTYKAFKKGDENFCINYKRYKLI